MFKRLPIGKKITSIVFILIFVSTCSIAFVNLYQAKSVSDHKATTSIKQATQLKKLVIQNHVSLAKEVLNNASKSEVIRSFDANSEVISKSDLKRAISNLVIKSEYKLQLLSPEGFDVISGKNVSALSDQKLLRNVTNKTVTFGQFYNHGGSVHLNGYLRVNANKVNESILCIKIDFQPILEELKRNNLNFETEEYILFTRTSKGIVFVNPAKKDSMPMALKPFMSIGDELRPIQEAANGKTGNGEILDYNNDKAMAYWSPALPELNSGIIGKVDYDESNADFREYLIWTLSISVIILMISVTFLILFSRTISEPLNKLRTIFEDLSKGVLFKEKIDTSREDEIGSMIHSVNEIVKYQRNIVEYARKVGDGDFTVAEEIKDESGDLSDALLNMTLSLKDASEKEELRNWSIKGLANFSDILRNNEDDMLKLGFSVISNLVNYLGINQGGLFVLNEKEDGTKVLTLTGCYAYERERFDEKEILIEEGLVGQCFIEQEKIYMTEVPRNYVSVTSGLGEATPESILLMPLKVNEDVYGVIELASFTEFKEHQIDFVEKLAESIASTIGSVKVAERTKKLLTESTTMSERMKTQEEELRQTMEEMQATQEGMMLNELRLSTHKTALENSCMIMELSMKGDILNINSLFTSITGFNSDDVSGKSISLLKNQKDNLSTFLQALKEIEDKSFTKSKNEINLKSGGSIEVEATFTGVKVENQIEKVIVVLNKVNKEVVQTTPQVNPQMEEEITKSKEKINELKTRVRELKSELKLKEKSAPSVSTEEIDQLKKENVNLQSQLEQATTLLTEMSNQSIETSDQSDLVQQLESEKSLLETKISELTDEIGKLKDSLDKVKESSIEEKAEVSPLIIEEVLKDSLMLLRIKEDGSIIGTNQSFTQTYGGGEDKVIGQSLSELINIYEGDNLLEDIKTGVLNNQKWVGDVLFKSLNSKGVWTEVTATQLNESEENKEYLLLMVDISA